MYVYVRLYFTFITRLNNKYAAPGGNILLAPVVISLTKILKNRRDAYLSNVPLPIPVFFFPPKKSLPLEFHNLTNKFYGNKESQRGKHQSKVNVQRSKVHHATTNRIHEREAHAHLYTSFP